MAQTISMPGSRPGRELWVGPVLIVLIVSLAYSNSFQGAMVFDDIDAISNNPEIRTLIPRQFTAVQTTVTGRPVLRFTFALNYAMGGLSVEGYHVTNLLIHLSACLLLFGILRRTLQLPVFVYRFENSAPWLATAITTIWGVHPLDTQAVTYIVQRAESLASMFYLGVIYFLIRASTDGACRKTWGVLAITSGLLGMGCKEMVATVPVTALIFDWIFLAGSLRAALRSRWPIYLGLAICWIILAAQIISGARGTTLGNGSEISPMDYALTQLDVVGSYLHLMIWPARLVFDEDGWRIAHSLAEIGLPGFAVILLGIATIALLLRRPKIGFAGAWFFLVLAPSSSFVPIVTEVAAEHRVYLPMAGLISLIVIGGWMLLQRWLAIAAGLAIIATLAILTFERNAQYRTAESIWRDTLTKRPTSARAHYNLAYALSEEAHENPEGSPRFVDLSAQAVSEYQNALKYSPTFAAEFRLAAALADAGDLAGAETAYDHLIQEYPNTLDGWNLLRGEVRARRQEWPAARDDLQKVVANRPNDPETHYFLGVVLQELNDPNAAAEFRRTLEIAPGYKDAELRLMKVQSGQ